MSKIKSKETNNELILYGIITKYYDFLYAVLKHGGAKRTFYIKNIQT